VRSETAVGSISLDGVAVEREGRAILRDVSVELTAQRIAVIGANGSGKSTFARLLNGLVLPDAGRVTVHDLDSRRDTKALRRRVGFVFTDPQSQILMPTPAEDLALSLRGSPRTEIASRVAGALAEHGLTDRADVPASDLSGGQKQLLALASVLIAEPRLIVADEPTTLLDLRNSRRVSDLLLALPSQVVIVTHDLDLAARCDHCGALRRGFAHRSGHPGRGDRRVPRAVRMIQSYRPGASIFHRMSAGPKLALFAALALVSSAYPHDGWSVTVSLVVVCTLYLVAGLPVRVLIAEIWRLRWLVLVLGTALWIFVSPLTAWISTSRVASLLLLAALLTITTRMGDLLAFLHRMLRPLHRLGVDADAVAMTISLTLTMIPVVAGFARAVREAQRARGVRPGLRTTVPLMVRTLRHADEVGDALAARGLV